MQTNRKNKIKNLNDEFGRIVSAIAIIFTTNLSYIFFLNIKHTF